MEWFYVVDGEKQGPVSKADIQGLIKARKIDGDTLVWREGMEDWKPLASLSRKSPEPELKSKAGERDAPGIQRKSEGRDMEIKPKAPAGPPAKTETCSQCGGTFPEDETILYEDARICAGCKPLFMQKLREGVRVSGEMEYGGFWIRFGAKIIDGIVIGLVQLLISIPFYFFFTASPEALSPAFILIQVIGVVLPAAYATWFVGKYGATPGKMACKLVIVTSDGGKISYARALGRHFGEWLSSIILMIGYLMAAFDAEKRTLHDRICDTRVIKVRK